MGSHIPILCPHSVLGKAKCKECVNEYHREYRRDWRKNHLKSERKYQREWRKDNPNKQRIYNYIQYHPERYPLDSECAFCGRTEKLEHGHLDYEDDGFNYLTVCHQCNIWMDRTMTTKERLVEFVQEGIKTGNWKSLEIVTLIESTFPQWVKDFHKKQALMGSKDYKALKKWRKKNPKKVREQNRKYYQKKKVKL